MQIIHSIEYIDYAKMKFYCDMLGLLIKCTILSNLTGPNYIETHFKHSISYDIMLAVIRFVIYLSRLAER